MFEIWKKVCWFDKAREMPSLVGMLEIQGMEVFNQVIEEMTISDLKRDHLSSEIRYERKNIAVHCGSVMQFFSRTCYTSEQWNSTNKC